MGALKIDCYCNEKQMNEILDTIVNYLTTMDRNELCDIDEEIGGVRVCIDFEIFMDIVKVKAAEILDNNWELLFEDSAVLASRLRPLMKAYNLDHTQLVAQSKNIKRDQLAELGIEVEI